MKKFLVFVIAVIFGITKVNALTVVMEYDGDVTSWTFSTHKVSKYYSFLLSPFDEYVVNYDEAERITNLAYLGNTYTSTYYQATIQVLILQAMYPEYNVYLLNGSTVFDYSSYQKVLEAKLEDIHFTCECDGNTYEANYGEKFTFYGDCGGFGSYQAEGVKTYGSYSTFKTLYPFYELGMHEVFIHAAVTKSGNYVYASNARGASFTIYVNVVGNTVTFELDDDVEYSFELRDSDGTWIENITVTSDNNTYIYKKGTDLYLTDITNSDTYESLGTIVVEEQDDTDFYEVILTSTLIPVSININTYSTSYPDNELLEKLENDLTVMSGDEVITTCNGECNLELTPEQNYTIIDNLTGIETTIYITEDTNIILNRYVISGLLLSREASSVSLSGYLNNFIYYLDEFLLPDTYNITIDEIEYTLDLTNTDNYVYTDNGLLYYVELIEVEEPQESEDIESQTDEEEDEIEQISGEVSAGQDESQEETSNKDQTAEAEEVTQEETETSQELTTETITIDTQIEIDIPNTGIEQNALTYYTKKYYFKLII